MKCQYCGEDIVVDGGIYCCEAAALDADVQAVEMTRSQMVIDLWERLERGEDRTLRAVYDRMMAGQTPTDREVAAIYGKDVRPVADRDARAMMREAMTGLNY